MPTIREFLSLSRLRTTLWLLSVGSIYYLLGRASLSLVFEPEGIAPIWPLTGLFVSVILLTRPDTRTYLIAILFVVDLFLELSTGIPLGLAAIYSSAIALNAVLAAWLLTRFVGEEISFRRVWDVGAFLFSSVIVGTSLAALLAAAGASYFLGTPFGSAFRWWWSADATGHLLSTPLILSVAHTIRSKQYLLKRRQVVEAGFLFVSLVSLNFAVIGASVDQNQLFYLLNFLSFPFLIWAGLRFGVPGVMVASLLLTGNAIYFAVGPQQALIATDSTLNNILAIQLYIALIVITSLFLASAITQHRDAERILHRSEAALRVSEERYRRLTEQIPAIVYMEELRGDDRRLVYISPQAVDLLGIAADELFRRDYDIWIDHLHPEDAVGVRSRYRYCFTHGLPFEYEYRMIAADGRVLWIRDEAITTYDSVSGSGLIHGVFYDITEQKGVEARLNENVYFLTHLQEISQALHATTDLDDLIRLIFDALQALFGADRGMISFVQRDRATIEGYMAFGFPPEIVTDTVRQLYAEPHPDEDMLSIVVRTGEPLISFSETHPGSHQPTVEKYDIRGPVAQIPLHSRGDVIGVIGMTRWRSSDLADTSFTEAEVERMFLLTNQAGIAIENALLRNEAVRHALELEQRVVERTAELAVAKDRAEAADRIKSVFLASMSHELRTPLNSVIGFTGVMRRGLAGPLTAEQERQLGMIHSSAHHLLALINDVLDISRIEAGQVELRIGTFAVDQLISAVLRTMSVSAEQKGLLLTAELGAGIGRIVSDERRVTQVLLNLVNNSIKFSENGQIHIACYRRNQYLEVSVSDQGAGIPESEIEDIFKPFHQTHSEMHKPQQGTGLGLSICKRLLDLLGGDIFVESQVGKGSTFVFTLPLTGPGRTTAPEPAAVPATADVPET